MKNRRLSSSKQFCMIPWVHLNVWPTGEVLPCCIMPPEHQLANLKQSTLSEAWNSDSMRKLRLNMLKDTPSEACKRCYELERAGTSLRQYANKTFGAHYPVVESTAADGTVGKLNLPYLDIRFSNICNFKCRTCNSYLSSSWALERSKIDGRPAAAVQHATAHPSELWPQIEPLLDHVEEIYFAGGEPLLMEEHYKILDALARKKLFHVRLKYSTNFSKLTFKSYDAMSLWKCFNDVTIWASLDAQGAQGEYMRKGQDWAATLQNRRALKERCPNVAFKVQPTLGILNALSLPGFQRDWYEQGLARVGDFHVNLLFEPDHYSIQALPRALKERVALLYREHVAWLEKNAASDESHVKPQFTGAIEHMMAADLSSKLGEFRRATKEFDDVRDESFVEIFPELATLLDEHEV